MSRKSGGTGLRKIKLLLEAILNYIDINNLRKHHDKNYYFLNQAILFQATLLPNRKPS